METKTKAYLFLIASLIIGSLTPVLLAVAKVANLYEFFFFTYLIAAPLGILLILRTKKYDGVKALLKNRKRLLYLTVACLLLFVPYEYGIAYAEHFASASLVTVIFRVNPLLMLLFLPLILKERLSRNQIIALGLGFIGILIAFSGGNLSGFIGSASLPIVAFCLGLALAYALSNVIVKKHIFDTDILISLAGVVMLGFATVLYIAAGAPLAPISNIDIGIMVYVAVTNVVSFYMFFHALKMLKVTFVSNVFTLSPFLTFLWAAAILGEPVQIYYIAIAVLAAAGIIIQQRDKAIGSYNLKAKRLTIFDVTGVFANARSSEINGIVMDGGRVMAAKLDKSHEEHVKRMTGEQAYRNVYHASSTKIASEAAFIKDIVDVQENETFVLKAGPEKENDSFFMDLNTRINQPLQEYNQTGEQQPGSMQ